MGNLQESLNRVREIMGVITEDQHSSIRRIQVGDVPCDIWCEIKVAEEGSRGDVVKMIQHVLARGCGEQ